MSGLIKKDVKKMTSKQRAYLKSLANSIDPILHIGKGGISDALVKQADDALEARELIKLKCLENSEYSPKEAAEEIAGRIGADVVFSIGIKAVLYRKAKKNPKIELPR